MSNKVQHKRSSVAGKIPTAADLETGEIALNLSDKKIYTKDGGGNVISLADESALIAIKAHDPAAIYPANGMVQHQDGIWRAKAPVVAEAWNAAHWTRIDTDGAKITSGAGGTLQVVGSKADVNAALNQIIAAQLYIEKDPTGSQSIVSGGAVSDVPLTIQGMAAQTGNLQQWSDSTGKVLLFVDKAGLINGKKPIVANPDAGASQSIITTDDGNTPLTLQAEGVSGGLTSSQIWKVDWDGAGTVDVVARMTDGGLQVTDGAFVQSTVARSARGVALGAGGTIYAHFPNQGHTNINSRNANLDIQILKTTTKGLVIQEFTGQTADLIQANGFIVNKDGKIKLPATTKTALDNATSAADIKAVLQQIFV